MRTDAKRKQNRRAGFSMIEVLVASTILVVIVMMLSMLFQQTSVAWRTGQIRAKGAMRLRSYLGSIQRDASAAIDAKDIPQALLYNDEKQSFKSDEIRFYTMTGDSNTFSAQTPKLTRSLSFIIYTRDGTRTKRSLLETGWQSTPDVTKVLDFLNSGSSDEKSAVAPQGFAFKWSDAKEVDDAGILIPDVNRFPLYITVDAKIVQKGRLYDVGAESSGPDGEFGNNPDTSPGKDDIRTWVK